MDDVKIWLYINSLKYMYSPSLVAMTMIVYKTDTRATQSNKYPVKHTKCMVIKKRNRLIWLRLNLLNLMEQSS
jgi:hypothetical protein